MCCLNMGSQIPSPTYISKYQHEGKVPTFEPQKTIKSSFYSFNSTLDYFMQILGTCVESWI